jgi:hypothetical protein
MVHQEEPGIGVLETRSETCCRGVAGALIRSVDIM